jgi:acyl-CoA dehydrogenase
VATAVIDRAVQLHGAGGVSDDFPLARMWTQARTLRLADGPDEVHVRTVAREELRRYRSSS